MDEIAQLVRDAYTRVNRDYLIEQAESACRYCPNNPRNGGSGICECILDAPVIDAR